MENKSAPILNIVEVPPSLKEVAFQSIKQAIFSGRLEPGQIYSEQNLAKEMGISKTPVREALLELAAKGFAIFLPRKGIRINHLNKKQIRDIFILREILEKGIIHLITPNISDEALQEIEDINNKEIDAVERSDVLATIQYNRKFHACLAALTDNQYIISALENIHDLIDWATSTALLHKEYMQIYVDQHRKIVGMLKKRDLKGAERMVEDHIRYVDNVVQQDFPAQSAGS